MALGTPTLVTPSLIATADTVTTGTFTPAGSALLVVRFGSRLVGALPGLPSINNSGGLTFMALADAFLDSGNRHRARAWGAMVPVSPPSNMTVDATSVSATRVIISVVQVTGSSGVPTNAIANANGAGDPTMVLGSAPAASSIVLAFLSGASATSSSVTPPAGFNELEDFANSTGGAIGSQCCYHSGPSPPTSSGYSTTTYFESVGIAVEVVEGGAAGGSGGIVRPPRRFQHMLIR